MSTTDPDIERVRDAKNRFYAGLDRFKVPVDLQVALWDMAYTSGTFMQHKKNMADFKKFSDGFFKKKGIGTDEKSTS